MKWLALILMVCVPSVAVAQRPFRHVEAQLPADDSTAWYLTVFAADDAEGQALIQTFSEDSSLADVKDQCRWNVITPSQKRYDAFRWLDGHLPAVALQRPDGVATYLNYGVDCTPEAVAAELPGSLSNCFGEARWRNTSADPPPIKVEQDAGDNSENKQGIFGRRPKPCPGPGPCPTPTPAPQPVTPVAGPPKQVRPSATSSSAPVGLFVGAGLIGLVAGVGIAVSKKLRS